MSAQHVVAGPHPEVESRRRSPLRLLPAHKPILSPLGFGLVIAVLVVFGLGGVMVVSTSVAVQSRELASLRREATELGYTSAALTTELQSKSSAASLALFASQLGMVPNPYPAFIRLSDGVILGKPTEVTGREMPFLRGLGKASTHAPQTHGMVIPAAQQQAQATNQTQGMLSPAAQRQADTNPGTTPGGQTSGEQAQASGEAPPADGTQR